MTIDLLGNDFLNSATTVDPVKGHADGAAAAVC
jgi:hypothetical protein